MMWKNFFSLISSLSSRSVSLIIFWSFLFVMFLFNFLVMCFKFLKEIFLVLLLLNSWNVFMIFFRLSRSFILVVIMARNFLKLMVLLLFLLMFVIIFLILFLFGLKLRVCIVILSFFALMVSFLSVLNKLNVSRIFCFCFLDNFEECFLFLCVGLVCVYVKYLSVC